jgi:hypothetical protein
VSCDFGQFDVAGFPKSHAFWYSANWLQGFGAGEPGRPALPFQTVARVLELPEVPSNATTATTTTASSSISAVTTAPFAALFLDGVSYGVRPTLRNARGEIQTTEWPVHSAAAAAAAAAAAVAAPCTGTVSFPVNASGVQCHGLHRASPGDKSDGACAAACCADGTKSESGGGGGGCTSWQRCTSNGGACWVGRASEGVGKCGAPKQAGATWVGGQRCDPGPAPAPTPPPAPVPPYTPFRNATLVAYSGDPGEVTMAAGAAVFGTAGALGGAPVTILATHSVFAPSADASGYKLLLTVDVPSAGTGTGGALLLDGRDTALVRCAVVDGRSHDALVSSTAAHRITWRVLSGAGRVAGTSSGNTTSLEWMKSPSIDTYLGLARGLFRVTQDCTSAERASCLAVDADAGRGPTAVKAAAADCDTRPIVVEASAPGFAPVAVSVAVSVDAAKDGVMAVARATGSGFAAGFSYLHDFVG